MNDLNGSRVWSLKEKSQLLVLAREEGALPTSIAWLTGEGSQASPSYLGVWRSSWVGGSFSLVACGVPHWWGVA